MSGELDDEYEYPVATRGGEERVLSWRSITLRDESGHVSGMICSGQDLTMLRQINNALENSEERFHVMMESVREDEFFIMDTEGYIISWIRVVKRARVTGQKRWWASIFPVFTRPTISNPENRCAFSMSRNKRDDMKRMAGV